MEWDEYHRGYDGPRVLTDAILSNIRLRLREAGCPNDYRARDKAERKASVETLEEFLEIQRGRQEIFGDVCCVR